MTLGGASSIGDQKIKFSNAHGSWFDSLSQLKKLVILTCGGLEVDVDVECNSRTSFKPKSGRIPVKVVISCG